MHIYISPNREAVDAGLQTKAGALEKIAAGNNLRLSQIGAIGDGLNDLPFLRVSGLGLVGTPSNGHPKVKEFVSSLKQGVLPDAPYLDGFLHFYNLCSKGGIRHIVSDRDGVLIKDGDLSRGTEFIKATSTGPMITVLTSSSARANMPFAERYFNGNQSDPWRIRMENGSLEMNVYNRETRLDTTINPDEMERFLGTFRPAVLQAVEHMIHPKYGFGYTNEHGSQHNRMYLPPMQTMVTINIPRTTTGSTEYRSTPEAVQLRSDIVGIMVSVCKDLKIGHTVLS